MRVAGGALVVLVVTTVAPRAFADFESAVTLAPTLFAVGERGGEGHYSPGGLALVELIGYLAPVRSDATPSALRPMLQRVGWFRLAIGGSLRRDESALGGGDQAAVRFDADGRAYLRRWLAITAASGYRREERDDSERWAVPASVGVVLRTGDLECAIAGEAAYFRSAHASGGSSDRFALRISLDGRAVLVEHLDLAFGGTASDRAIDAYLQGAYYASPRLGLLGGGFGGGQFDEASWLDESGWLPRRGHAPIAGRDLAHFGSFVGLRVELSASMAIEARYAATWIAGEGTGATDQRILVSLSSRLGSAGALPSRSSGRKGEALDRVEAPRADTRVGCWSARSSCAMLRGVNSTRQKEMR